MSETIKEAAARLDGAVASLRALKAGQGPKVRKAWGLEYQMAKRALALASARAAAKACWADFGTGVMTTEERPEFLHVLAEIEAL
jgi:hypothetical protein